MVLKVHIPKTYYNRFSNPYKIEKTHFGLRSLHCGNHGMSCRLRNLAEDPRSCPRTAQLLRSCFPAPTGPQHSLVARPRATGCCSLSLLFSFFDFWFVLSLCCTTSAQEIQGLQTIVQQFPLVESDLCLYGHFSILAFPFSLVSELSVPHSSVHLPSSWLSSLKLQSNRCFFIADLQSEVVTIPFPFFLPLSGYMAVKERSELFPPYWMLRHL